MNDIHLFFGEREIQFSKEPDIMFQYQIDDIANPTAIKNSYTKAINIEGTDDNNDILGHFYDLERVQSYGDGVYTGTAFNAIKKTDFKLYYNGNIYESGYFKLDSVVKRGNTVTYGITLYGGLGQFLYNLMYRHLPGVNAEGPDKMTLADLIYDYEGDLGFVINKDTVYDAWNVLNENPEAYYSEADLAAAGGRGRKLIAGGTGYYYPYLYDNKWRMLNFIPAYNGKPSDFANDKVLINNYGLGTILPYNKTVDDEIYRSVSWTGEITTGKGYTLGECGEEMTEWETFDLRSYLQRPAINFKAVIDACCNPLNNGGWEVKLDDHFFAYDNPYYSESWLTLPMIRDLEIQQTEGHGSSEGITASLGQLKNQYQPININGVDTLSDYNNLNIRLQLKFNPNTAATANSLYSDMHYEGTGIAGGSKVKEAEYAGEIIVQLVAYNVDGSIVAVSKPYEFAHKKTSAKNRYGDLNHEYYEDSPELPSDVPFEYMEGYFRRIDGEYIWCNMSGTPTAVDFSLTTPNNFSRLALHIAKPYSDYVKYHGFGGYNATWDGDATYANLFTDYDTTGKKMTASDITNKWRVRGSYDIEIENFELTAFDYESLFSGTYVPKDKLLATEASPAEYLVSFCKMFGLYLYSDPGEQTSDPDRYPSGVIHIVDRDTFYKRDEVENIDNSIDRSKDITITPAMAVSKWYSLNTEQVDSECNDEYKENYGRDFGEQRIDTNYDFNADITQLLKDNVIKGGVMCQESDKYFNERYSTGEPVYVRNGLTVSLFKTGENEFDTTEVAIDMQPLPDDGPINEAGLKRYDMFPKLQLHTAENEPSDGKDILVFLRQSRPNQQEDPSIYATTNYYYITDDDIPAMAALNDGEACWILTNDEYDAQSHHIAYDPGQIPSFSRYISYQPTHKITHSWDMGATQVVYVPDIYATEGMSIYDRCWRNYINDMYSVNTRRVSCYVYLPKLPSINLLRKFYWWDNSIWRLNAITEWNVASNEPTKCEFIKVQDLDNYALEPITEQGRFELKMDVESISADAQSVGGYTYAQDGGLLIFADSIYTEGEADPVYLDSETVCHPYSGYDAFAFTIDFPANTKGHSVMWRIELNSDIIEDAPWTYLKQGTWRMTLAEPESDYGFTAHSETVYYTISNMTDTSASTNVNWATAVINREDNEIEIVLQANTTDNARRGTVTFRAKDSDGEWHTKSVDFVQRPSEAVWVLESSAYDVRVSNDGGTTAVPIHHEGLTGMTATANAQWLTPTISGQSLDIVSQANPTPATPRKATITIEGTDTDGISHSIEIDVVQSVAVDNNVRLTFEFVEDYPKTQLRLSRAIDEDVEVTLIGHDEAQNTIINSYWINAGETTYKIEDGWLLQDLDINWGYWQYDAVLINGETSQGGAGDWWVYLDVIGSEGYRQGMASIENYSFANLTPGEPV